MLSKEDEDKLRQKVDVWSDETWQDHFFQDFKQWAAGGINV